MVIRERGGKPPGMDHPRFFATCSILAGPQTNVQENMSYYKNADACPNRNSFQPNNSGRIDCLYIIAVSNILAKSLFCQLLELEPKERRIGQVDRGLLQQRYSFWARRYKKKA